MFALIGALNRKVERLFNPDRKDHQRQVVPRDPFIRRVWNRVQFLCCSSATKLLFLFREPQISMYARCELALALLTGLGAAHFITSRC